MEYSTANHFSVNPSFNMAMASTIVFLLLIIAAVGQSVYYYPRLPDKMASHFDFDGRPDGWMNKGAFLRSNAITLNLLSAFFVFFGFTVPSGFWFADATLLLLLLVLHKVYAANVEATLRIGGAVWMYVALYMIFVVGWIWYLQRVAGR